MIQSLSIHNFRCFKDFTLNNTARINIIAAKNNIGKTTLLESIFLLIAYNNPDILIKANMLRGILLTSFSPDIAWEHFFYDKKVENSISISSNINNRNAVVKFEKDETFNFRQAIIPATEDLRPIADGYPLKITFSYGNFTHSGHMMPLQKSLTTTWQKALPKDTLPIVQYLGPGSEHTQNLVHNFGRLEKAGKKEELIKIFQVLDKDLADITTIVEETPRLYAKKYNGPLLPLSVMGNGLCKLMRILCAMLDRPNSIILIDEIETGFYHKFMFDLWKLIEKLAVENNIQIFATTHSLECIQAASEAIEDKNNIMYVRLGKNAHGIIKPYIFEGGDLEFSLEQNMEIR